MNKIKKIITAVITAAITASLPMMHMYADDNFAISQEDPRYKYIENDDGTCSVAANEHEEAGLSGAVEIPKTLGERTVKSICKSGFTGTSITEITIPDTVTEIEPLAFANCLTLSKVNLPKTITKVGEIAFSNTAFEAELLKNSDPEFVKIDDYILYLYTGHERDVVIPDNISVIANSAFANNTEIASVTIPDNVEYIGDNTFEKCSNLTKIIMKSGVKSVGENAISSGEGITIYGYTGTYAESFAKENGNTFVALIEDDKTQLECEYDENFKQYYFSTDEEFSKEGIHIYKRYADGTRIEITDSINWDFLSSPKELYDKANSEKE